MNLRHTLVALGGIACLALPLTASAQPSATTAPPPGDPGAGPNSLPPPDYVSQHHMGPVRRGLMLGFGLGGGAMESSSGPIECIDCSDSAMGSANLHIGYMLNPRLGVMYEAWGTAQKLDAAESATLVQVLSMAAAQYWVTPRVWVKGGIGTAHLIERYKPSMEGKKIDTGLAVMGAVGVELLQGRKFAMDVQLRGGSGTYDGIGDRITQGSLQLGFSWY